MPISTVAAEALESLQSSLEPLSESHGENSQLEAWVNDSCQALEKLHTELTQWQNELARKQTELDLREDALEKCKINEDELGSQVEQWQIELTSTQQALSQLQEENTDQLEQLEQLERRCIELEGELKQALERNAELKSALEAERSRTATEQSEWKEEFKGMRELLDKQCLLLANQLNPNDEYEPALTSEMSDSALRSQELRRRAQSRLAAKRLQQIDQDLRDSEDS